MTAAEIGEAQILECRLGLAGASLPQIAQFGVIFIERQFEELSMTAAKAAQDIWGLGYCFGVFDALGQRASLERYTGGLALLTIGFLRLFADNDAGPNQLSRAFDNQTDPSFAEGNVLGGSEINDYLKGRVSTDIRAA